MKVLFQPIETFRATPKSYQLLPFRFLRWNDGNVFVTNEAGEHIFVDSDTFDSFIGGNLRRDDLLYSALKSKHLLADSGTELPLRLLATKVRTKKDFLRGGVKLHLFVVTLRCDHSCQYCQVSRVTQDRTRFDMTTEVAGLAIDVMFRSPSEFLKVEFQGGEALLNFDLVRWCVERIEARNASEERRVEFVIATNLVPLTDEILAFCKAHNVALSTSLDGPAFIHNRNRPRPGGDSHEILMRNLERAREVLGHGAVSALMTTTPLTLAHPRELVDEYVECGFQSIFLRSISPYGFAVRGAKSLAYETEQFLQFYATALAYIIDFNRRGTRLVEVFSQILLRKILTPFSTGYVDLQSPAGAATSVVAYNYDGDVYASDEGRMLAEMHDESFRLGNLRQHSYEELFGGPVARALVQCSVSETLPGCADCAFVPFCGSDPVFHWATQGDPVGHRPTSAFCQKQMGLFKHLFGLLKDGDEFTRSLLLSWATGMPRERTP